MALPLNPIPTTLAPDDVRTAELVSEVDRFCADSVDHFAREHLTSGRHKGRHDVVTVYSAVARLEFPSWPLHDDRGPTPEELQVRWAVGFSKVPRLVVGPNPLFTPQYPSGISLLWEIAETRPGYQLVALTPTWADTGLPSKPRVRTVRREGAIYLSDNWTHGDTNRAGFPPWLRGLAGLTIGIHMLVPRV